jgi:hypothetical protein
MIINKKWANLRHNEWEKPCFFWFIWNITTVHENIFPPTMSMEITKYLQFSFFSKLGA